MFLVILGYYEVLNTSEERITNTDEKVLILIKDIMSDFTEVVKMLTDTMNAQLSIIKDQEKNSAESIIGKTKCERYKKRNAIIRV